MTIKSALIKDFASNDVSKFYEAVEKNNISEPVDDFSLQISKKGFLIANVTLSEIVTEKSTTVELVHKHVKGLENKR